MQKEIGVSVSCKDGGVIPDSGFPRDGDMANEERAKTSLGHGANTSISYNTHAFVHGRRLGVIPLKRALSERVEFDGRGTLVVEVLVGSTATVEVQMFSRYLSFQSWGRCTSQT